ncbi:hypothetical protein MNBD_GAMMA23-1164 [hydrothermal vent metagenome]|uniref:TETRATRICOPEPTIDE REPEAT FAMILY PROTEIN n=1 Tax=hydrothermal vent metagenome TaxID=652676 RepID=A0A3B1ALI7_9ZZZZ
MSKVKAKRRQQNNVKSKMTLILFATVVFLLIIGQQIAHSAAKQTLNKISYSEMEAINKGMGLIKISARVQVQNEQFNAAVKAYIEEEYALALRLFEPLAMQGHSASQYYLGVLHDMGIESAGNARVAYQWYRLAAIGGDDRAQHNLAVAYAKGEGVEANLVKAMKWWMLSSLQGNADSQYNLGILYAMGQGSVQRDIVKAIKWWRKAATSGDAVAQFNLGTIYANGDSGAKNYCEAERWWVQSAESGFSEAYAALTVLRKRSDYYSCE